MKLLKKNKGFTVVELVIVIGVIAVLSALLIPTFVNVTENAKKAAAQADCRTAYSAYALEAHDQVWDEGTAYAGTTLALAKEEKVQLTRDGKEYHFDDKKGWVAGALELESNETLTYVALTKPAQASYELSEASVFEGITVRYAKEA